MRIGFDLMGSDAAPSSELETLRLLLEDPVADLVVCGRGDFEHDVADLGYEFQLADEVIGMHEIPSVAIRKKKKSSIGVLMNLLSKKRVDAVVSAGNTGAILGYGMIVLGKIGDLSRPGLAIMFPAETGYSIILDVGANINPKSVDYYNYGIMGSVLCEAVMDKKNPRVAILNIGSESMKGDELKQKAYQIMEASALNFIGNIEGNHIMKGFADVIVCDGFTGNVLLKFSEGMIDTVWSMLREEVDAIARRKFGQFLVRPAVQGLKARFNYEEYGGGILLGVEGVVVVCHGRSSPTALKNAIKFAATCVEHNIIGKTKERLRK